MQATLKITEKQQRFLNSNARTVIYRGGIRGGKTWVLCIKAILKAMQGRRFCLVSFSYPALRDVVLYTLRMILDLMGLPYKVNYSNMTVQVTDNVGRNIGQEIMLRSGDRPDSLRGLSLDDVGIDEAREFKSRSIYDILIGRLSNSSYFQIFIASTTKGKNWVEGLESESDAEVITQTTFENPFVSTEYKEFLRQKYTSDFARQELYADIVEFGAGIIDANWFHLVDYFKPVTRSVRFWDLAVSIKTSADFTAGALVSNGDRVTIHDIVRGKMEYPDIRRKIIETAKDDGTAVTIAVEEAGQQRGFIDDLKRIDELAPYSLIAIKPHGDKLNRAMPWASRAQLGMVDVCHGNWNRDFFEECNSFTADDSHAHDDQIDAVSGAYTFLAGHDICFSTSSELSEGSNA